MENIKVCKMYKQVMNHSKEKNTCELTTQLECYQ